MQIIVYVIAIWQNIQEYQVSREQDHYRQCSGKDQRSNGRSARVATAVGGGSRDGRLTNKGNGAKNGCSRE